MEPTIAQLVHTPLQHERYWDLNMPWETHFKTQIIPVVITSAFGVGALSITTLATTICDWSKNALALNI